MSEGRTTWRAKDAGWWRREWIVTLGVEFGSDGPAVIDWLECEAKLQNDGGFVKTGPLSISRGAFVELVTVSHVLSRSVTLGLLEEYEEHDGRFTCRISGWEADQAKARAAARKAKQRSGDSEDTGDFPATVTVSHGESRSVTECPPTRQDKTRQTDDANASSSRSPGNDLDKEVGKASDDDRRLCRLFAELAKANNPKLKIGSGPAWLKAMRLMREQDGHAPEEIERVIRWLFEDKSDDATFWASTIQAPSGLREHFAQVWAKLQRPVRSVPNPQQAAVDAERQAAVRRLRDEAA